MLTNGLCSRQAGDCERLSSEDQQADLEQQNCNSNASPGWRLHFVGGSPVPSSRFFSFHKLTIPTVPQSADRRFGTFPVQPFDIHSSAQAYDSNDMAISYASSFRFALRSVPPVATNV